MPPPPLSSSTTVGCAPLAACCSRHGRQEAGNPRRGEARYARSRQAGSQEDGARQGKEGGAARPPVDARREVRGCEEEEKTQGSKGV